MNPAVKLGGFAVGLILLVAGSFAAGRILLPEDPAKQAAPAVPTPTMSGHGGGSEHDGSEPEGGTPSESEGHGGHNAGGSGEVRGLSLEQDGFRLSPPAAPTRIGQRGTLEFMIMDAEGKPVTDFEVSHEKKLHLIMVRTDGREFRHVHPTMAADGTWSIPWRWPTAGTFRMFADFVPTASGDPTTLGYAFDVPGDLRPEPATKIKRISTVDGYQVTLAGDLAAHGESELTVTVTRDGKPVTTLQPYLGAYGHLVILRQGDLGYLHVHPEGAEPKPGETSGPAVTFIAQAPTESRYLLYFDFQVGGKVRTAEFVLGGDDSHEQDHESEDPEADDHGHGEQEER